MNTNLNTNLLGDDIISPCEGICYNQNYNSFGCVILSSEYIPVSTCNFSIKTQKGLYLLNNSKIIFKSNPFLEPNKIYNFKLDYNGDNWILVSDKSYKENNIIINWTEFFNSKISGAPPIIARKYAIFINGIYNTVLNFTDIFKEAVINESANILSNNILTDNLNSPYNIYEKCTVQQKNQIEIFLLSFLSNKQIPPAATNNSYTNPIISKTRWSGINPVLPNWNSANINYFKNQLNPALSDPESQMAEDSLNLKNVIQTMEKTEIAKHFAKTPPPSHLISLTCVFLENYNLDYINFLKTLSIVSIGLSDAGIYSWTIKYQYWGARPFQYIENYIPVITTPNFPGFISGHSTFSAVWCQLLKMTHPQLSDICNYIAELSGISRIYGGIHFISDNIKGLETGRLIGKNIYENCIANLNLNTGFLI